MACLRLFPSDGSSGVSGTARFCRSYQSLEGAWDSERSTQPSTHLCPNMLSCTNSWLASPFRLAAKRAVCMS